MAKFSPVTYFQQVKSEVRKITWPSRKETIMSTVAVFIMVIFASLFLFAADQIMSLVVKLILSIGL